MRLLLLLTVLYCVSCDCAFIVMDDLKPRPPFPNETKPSPIE